MNAKKGDNKIKIYCILFDTMPLINEMIKMAEINKMRKFLQIGGCFTIISLLEMFTGKLPSDYVSHGIGHSYLNRYRNKVSKEIYVPWYKDFIMKKLSKQNWKIRTHDIPTDNFVHGDVCTDSWEGGHEQRLKIFKKFKNIREGGRTVDKLLITDSKKSKEWHQRECEFICSMQKEKPEHNTFYFIDYEHFHSLSGYKKGKQEKHVKKVTNIVINKIMNLVNTWDFNEPNSIFWFFSDHGFPSEISRASIIPKANSYLSWAFVKDNIIGKNFNDVEPSIISIRDFMPSVMEKFSYKYEQIDESYPMFDPLNKKRVYFIEDGRKVVDEMVSTTVVACRVIEWIKDKPIKILQVGYFSKNKKFNYDLNILDNNGFFIKSIKLNKKDDKYKTGLSNLKKKLIKRFKWVK